MSGYQTTKTQLSDFIMLTNKSQPQPPQVSHPQNTLAKKISFSSSELTLLRIILAQNKLDFHHPSDRQKIQKYIKQLLENYQLDYLDPALVAFQIYIEEYPPATNIPSETTALTESYSTQRNSTNPLFWAARKGDVNELALLIKQGWSINATDIFGSTPLHIASLYGHNAIVEFLLKKGAFINATTYYTLQQTLIGDIEEIAYTPLDLAVYYAPLSTVNLILQQGGTSYDTEFLLLNILEKLEYALHLKHNESFEEQMSKLEVLQNHHTLPTFVNLASETMSTLPVATLFYQILRDFQTKEHFSRMQQLAAKLEADDPHHAHERFVLAKNLLHIFPSSNEYECRIDSIQFQIQSEGHYPYFLVAFSEKSIAQFIEKIPSHVPLKQSIFNTLLEVYQQATHHVQMSGLFEESRILFEKYDSGKTILLPTGWNGHFINIILDKALNLFMVANGGERYADFKPGINAYQINFKPTEVDIYNILTNKKEIDLEFKYSYDLWLTQDPAFSLVGEEQLFGNCGWHSNQIAQKGLLYLEIYKATHNHSLARSLSTQWLTELNDFHKMKALEDYIQLPSLEVSALSDILTHYHAHLRTPQEKIRAQIICEHLMNIENAPNFIQHHKEHPSEFTRELNQIIKQYSARKPILIDEILHENTNIDHAYHFETLSNTIIHLNEQNPPTQLLTEIEKSLQINTFDLF